MTLLTTLRGMEGVVSWSDFLADFFVVVKRSKQAYTSQHETYEHTQPAKQCFCGHRNHVHTCIRADRFRMDHSRTTGA